MPSTVSTRIPRLVQHVTRTAARYDARFIRQPSRRRGNAGDRELLRGQEESTAAHDMAYVQDCLHSFAKGIGRFGLTGARGDEPKHE